VINFTYTSRALESRSFELHLLLLQQATNAVTDALKHLPQPSLKSSRRHCSRMVAGGLCFDIAEVPIACAGAPGALVLHPAGTLTTQTGRQAEASQHLLPADRPTLVRSHRGTVSGTSAPHAGRRDWTQSLAHPAAHLQSGLHDVVDTPQHLTEVAAEAAGVHHDLIEKQETSLLARLPSLVASVGSLMQPQGEPPGDNTQLQRAINVVTSLPFLVLGAHMLHRHRTPEGRRFAGTMVGVGAAATLYHGSSGRMRRILRKADYWAISVSSTAMIHALFPHPRWVCGALKASLLAVPFKPFVLSTAHTLAMQAEFARQAASHVHIRPHFRRHAAAAVAGIIAFAFEDYLAERGFEHSHAMWHCLAAAGVATTGALVEHKERLRLEGARPLGAASSASSDSWSIHDSVVSLDALANNSIKSTASSKPGA
jgi:hypothetical protein